MCDASWLWVCLFRHVFRLKDGPLLYTVGHSTAQHTREQNKKPMPHDLCGLCSVRGSITSMTPTRLSWCVRQTHTQKVDNSDTLILLVLPSFSSPTQAPLMTGENTQQLIVEAAAARLKQTEKTGEEGDTSTTAQDDKTAEPPTAAAPASSAAAAAPVEVPYLDPLAMSMVDEEEEARKRAENKE